jgi:20S proteasome alpha/beta subunit
MRKKIQILLTLIFFCCFNIVKSQTEPISSKAPKISPANPDVSALFKYTDIPVSNTTGIPNINIPIHEIKLKNYSLPIDVSYHSSGIVIDELASKVGLGWSLNAGGMIYQNVIGKPDNIHNRFPLLQNRELNPEVNEPAGGLCGIIQNEDYYTVDNLSSALSTDDVDSEPDIYYYSFGDKSGKFFFDNNNVAHTMPESDLKIIRDVNGIVIYDEMGVKFTFYTSSLSKSMWTITQTTVIVPSAGQSGETDSYSYYLTEIETPQKEKISITYNDYVYEYKNPDTKLWKRRPSSGGEGVGCDANVMMYYPLDIKQTIENLTFVASKAISKITTANQSIDFIYESCPRLDLPPTSGLSHYSPTTTGDFALKKIKISDSNAKKIDEFEFNYSYFNLDNYQPCVSQTSLTLMNSYRLKLEGIVKNSIEPYTFQYYSSSSIYIPNNLPDRLSGLYDNWNRFSYSAGGEFTYDPVFNSGGTNRDPNLESTLLGVLKQIKYPTGGVTRFTYELNKTYEGRTLPSVERNAALFITGTQETTGEPNQQQNLQTDFTISKLDGPVHFTCNVNMGEQTSTNWVTLSLFDHQSNSYVTLACTNEAKNIYLSEGTYTLYVSGVTEGGGASFQWFEKRDEVIYDNYDIGGLRIQEIASYDKEVDSQPSIRKKYSYTLNSDATRQSGKVINKPRYSFVEHKVALCCIDVIRLGGFDLYYQVLQNKIVEPLSNLNGYHIMYTDVQIYDDTNKTNGFSTFKYNFSENNTNYNFSWPQTPATNLDFLRGDLIEQIDYSFVNGGFKKVQESKYEYFDNYDTVFFDANAPYKYCIGLNLTTLNKEFRCGGGYAYCVRAVSQFLLGYYKLYSIRKYVSKETKTIYDLNGNSPITSIKDFKYANLGHSQPTSTILTSSKGESLENKYFYAKDPAMAGQPFISDMVAGNMIVPPLKMQTFNGSNQLSEQLTVYAKDATTNNLLLPKDLYAAKFPNSLPNISNVGNLEKKITYNQYDDKGNILQYTPESGIPVSIILGYNKTLPIAKVENTVYNTIPTGTISTLQSLSDADNDNCMSADCTEQLLRSALNIFRNSLPNAFITTYTYNPLVGVTSVTDPKGISSYYEYDAVGRLKFVKDQDLNVLQKYCYNYIGQQVNCADNTSTSVVLYKSIARSGSFTRNNCASGGTGSSVSYSQPVGAVISTISQADADANGLAKFNTDGQANANASGTCTFSSIARSGSFTRNNCAAGGTGSSVSYSQAVGASTSTISQADADSKGLAKFNTDGQANANTNGTCTFYNVVKSGTFTRNNCAAGGTGSSVTYAVAAGTYNSTTSQTVADALAQTAVNNNGQAYANVNGTCTFYNVVKSGTFTRNNCAAGGTGSSVTYTVAAGTYNSTASQAAADALAQTAVNNNGQAYANTNGTCTFYNVVKSGTFTRNNCAAGGTGSSVTYTVAAGTYNSTTSQAAADALAQTAVNNNGQAYANTNGTCTFYNVVKSGTFTRNNCGAGGTGGSVTYTVAARTYNSTSSQAVADTLAQTDVNNNGQAYANTNGTCTFYNVAKSGTFTRNNCAVGGNPSSLTYSVAAGIYNSNTSQAAADALAQTDVNNNGQNYVNANAACTFYNVAKSGTFTKNNCAAGGVGSSVTYTVGAGSYSSTTSQAAADALAQTAVNNNGQAYANANGYCTFYSIAFSYTFTKNNCGAGGVGSGHFYSQPAGAETSNTSQEDANSKGYVRFLNDGQAYANANGDCTFSSVALGGYFAKTNCPAGSVSSSSSFYYGQSAGAVTSKISQADADSRATAKFNIDGPAYANSVGECEYYSSALTGTFTKSNCPAGGTGSSVVYSLGYGAARSTVSQAQADAAALNLFNFYGQAQADAGTCTFRNKLIIYQIYKNDYCPPGTTFPYVYYTVDAGIYQSNISQADADNKAWADVTANAQVYANANGRCLNPGEAEE